MRRATNGETVWYGGSGERATRSSNACTWGWTPTGLFHCREHAFQPVDEKGCAFHHARLLALHQRPDLGHIRLPVRIGGHRGAAAITLVEALVGPHVHDHVERADLGDVVAHHVRQVLELHLHAVVLVVLEVFRSGARLQRVHALFDVHGRVLQDGRRKIIVVAPWTTSTRCAASCARATPSPWSGSRPTGIARATSPRSTCRSTAPASCR